MYEKIRRWLIKSYSCEKDRDKVCSQKSSLEVYGAGQLACSSDAYMRCCKSQELMKQLKSIKVNRK